MTPLLTEEFNRALSDIDEYSIKAYEDKLHVLIEYVNKSLTKRTDFRDLTGFNPVGVMKNNHENHGQFMVTMFHIKDTDGLFKTLLWVYSSYISRGFSPDYFPAELSAWMEGVDINLEKVYSEKINKIYSLMIKNHENFLSYSREDFNLHIDENFIHIFNEYMETLIDGDMYKAVNVAKKYINTVSDISDFWLNVIEPAMYKIGHLWSSGVITVGQEHLASSITQRLMAMFYPMILELPRRRKSIVITASPGELHTIGSQMISDLLEINGWNVYYLGANTPEDSILSFLKEKNIYFVGISTTMIHNIKGVENLIKRIKIEVPRRSVKVIVGGQAYGFAKNLWKTSGADGFALNAKEAVNLMNRL